MAAVTMVLMVEMILMMIPMMPGVMVMTMTDSARGVNQSRFVGHPKRKV